MNVTVSVGGIFHAFLLAEQLEQRHALDRIYTTYPRFKIDSYDVPRHKVKPIRHPEAFFQTTKLPLIRNILPEPLRIWLVRQKDIRFDRAVAKRLEPTDEGIFVGFLSKSLESFQRANELGYTTVVESSISHVREQKELLDFEFKKYGKTYKKGGRAQIERREREYETADYISVPSEYAYSTFRKRGFEEEDLLNIPLGRDTAKYTVGTSVDETDGPVKFLFAGSVHLQKGVQYLLEAWDHLELADAELLIAGHVADNMKDMVTAYDDDETIRFLGWVEDMERLYNKVSVFVLPSLQDGFGMVVPEAMACGLPVIVSENTGAKDCVREGTDGFVVPIRDSMALADAMQRLYDDAELRSSMGVSAHEQAESNFSAEAYGDRVVATYRSIL